MYVYDSKILESMYVWLSHMLLQGGSTMFSIIHSTLKPCTGLFQIPLYFVTRC